MGVSEKTRARTHTCSHTHAHTHTHSRYMYVRTHAQMHRTRTCSHTQAHIHACAIVLSLIRVDSHLLPDEAFNPLGLTFKDVLKRDEKVLGLPPPPKRSEFTYVIPYLIR